MSVSRMLKFQLLGHASAKEAVVDELRKMEFTHIVDLPAELPDEMADGSRAGSALTAGSQGSETQDKFAKVAHVLDFLSPYWQKPGALESLLEPKLVISEVDQQDTLANLDLDELYGKCMELQSAISGAEAEKLHKQRLIDELEPWMPLDVALEEVVDTRTARVSLAIVEHSAFPRLQASLAELGETDLLPVNVARRLSFMLLAFARDLEKEVDAVLKTENCRLIEFPGLAGTPAEVVTRLQNEIPESDQALHSHCASAAELAKERDRLAILHDHCLEQIEKKGLEVNFAHTACTFTIQGWIRASDRESFAQKIGQLSDALEIVMEEPAAAELDRVPVALDNCEVIKPLEFVTTLFGRPVYTEFDPTPLMAPFFIIFFGLCMTDAAYGVIVVILSLVGLKTLKQSSVGTKMMFQVLLMAGIATFVLGALMGSWFGIETGPGWIPNPLSEPKDGKDPALQLFYLCLLAGVVHVFFGLAVKLWAEITQGKWVRGILNQGLWLAFLAFLVPVLYNSLFGEPVADWLLFLSCKAVTVLAVALVVSAVVLAVTERQPGKSPAIGILLAPLRLYDTVGYFADVLSYARLFALGLATGAIAYGINQVAGQAIEKLPGLGWVIAIPVVVGGHLFNVVINCLGAFIHSGRLQFLEFFSKFFEGGGIPFRPFRVERKYTVVQG